LYEESRRANVAWLNDQLERDIAQLSSILTDTLGVDDYFNLDTLKEKAQVPVFQPGRLAEAEQPPRLVAPEEPAGIKRFMPGAKEKHAEEVARAQQRYETELTAYNYREAARQQALNEIWSSYQQQVAGIHEKVAAQHAEIDKLKQDFAKGVPDAIVTYFMLVLEASNYPIDFPQQAKLAYVPESKQLVVEYELPPYDRVPTIGSYKYVKAKDEIAETPRPPTQRKALYASVVAQVTIRTLHELFEADRLGHLDTIVFNGYVNAVDPGTGQTVQPHLVTVRTTRDIFNQLDLRRVDPIACLTKLNASVSKKPDELAPVRPVVEFNMVDPRFIEETDVLSTLDQRPNLMELTPSEFEALISNLFQAMGLETRLTQASRDGGVDCVAYDSRPILGGKVVIQAKRYKNTVAVSAVRDLFGTVQNEGASKGILVTTSGYGKAAFEFAEGKPLELLSGSNLLYLLAEHAGLEARIEVPDNWKDPHPDSGSI
jgi:restriction system protein